jgi:hypothetical protein
MAGADADEASRAIRASTVDVMRIARSTGLKPKNVQIVKDHLFKTSHMLDKYVRYGVAAELRVFDSDLRIADAWSRLEAGAFLVDDMRLLYHEMAEAWYMRHHGPSYSAAHAAAQARFPSPL